MAEGTNWRRGASMRVITISRKLFANTPIQKLPLTTAIYRSVFRFGSPESEVTTQFRGITLTAPTGDTTIVPGIVGGFYEAIELGVLEQVTAKSNVILDVGANIGLYSCLAAKHAPKRAKIIAFEPVVENQDYLQRNIEQNELPSIVVEPMAVGEKSGDIKIYLVENSIGTHSVSSKNALESTTFTTVPVVTLDEYVAKKLKKPVDVLKVDVEGYEGSVLRGAKALLKKDKPTLFIEFVPFHLENCGFKPADFVKRIFSAYDTVFLIDEPRSSVRRCTADELMGEEGGYKNANLVAMSSKKHQDHIDAVETFVKKIHAS